MEILIWYVYCTVLPAGTSTKKKFRTPDEILKIGRRLLTRPQKVDLFWIAKKHPVSTLLSASEHFQ